MAVAAAAVVLLVNVTATFFASTPTLSPYLRGLPGNVHTVLLALIWLSFAQALVAIFAIASVSRWSADDLSGDAWRCSSPSRCRGGRCSGRAR